MIAATFFGMELGGMFFKNFTTVFIGIFSLFQSTIASLYLIDLPFKLFFTSWSDCILFVWSVKWFQKPAGSRPINSRVHFQTEP